MKQSKKLTRANRIFLESKGIKKEDICKYRFQEELPYSLVFVLDGKLVEFQK